MFKRSKKTTTFLHRKKHGATTTTATGGDSSHQQTLSVPLLDYSHDDDDSGGGCLVDHSSYSLHHHHDQKNFTPSMTSSPPPTFSSSSSSSSQHDQPHQPFSHHLHHTPQMIQSTSITMYEYSTIRYILYILLNLLTLGMVHFMFNDRVKCTLRFKKTNHVKNAKYVLIFHNNEYTTCPLKKILLPKKNNHKTTLSSSSTPTTTTTQNLSSSLSRQNSPLSTRQNSSSLNSHLFIHFQYQYQRYMYLHDSQQFALIDSMPLSYLLHEYKTKTMHTGLDSYTHLSRLFLFGNNFIHITSTKFIKVIVNELSNIFYPFQFITLLFLIFIRGYYFYSAIHGMCLLFSLICAIKVHPHRTIAKKVKKELALSYEYTSEIRVLRDSQIYMVGTSNLVPGDIIILNNVTTVPCDCILLSTPKSQRVLLCDESTLTGDTELSHKTPLNWNDLKTTTMTPTTSSTMTPTSSNTATTGPTTTTTTSSSTTTTTSLKEDHSILIDQYHVLIGGTRIVREQRKDLLLLPEKDEITEEEEDTRHQTTTTPSNTSNLIKALVIRTGFHTVKGSMIRNILLDAHGDSSMSSTMSSTTTSTSLSGTSSNDSSRGVGGNNGVGNNGGNSGGNSNGTSPPSSNYYYYTTDHHHSHHQHHQINPTPSLFNHNNTFKSKKRMNNYMNDLYYLIYTLVALAFISLIILSLYFGTLPYHNYANIFNNIDDKTFNLFLEDDASWIGYISIVFIFINSVPPYLIFIVVTLPMILTNRLLFKKNIKSIQSIDSSLFKFGLIDLVCYDKTGTLCESNMSLYGILTCNDLLHPTDDITQLSEDVTNLLACCHNLFSKYDKDTNRRVLIGDTIDQALLEFTNYELKRDGMNHSCDIYTPAMSSKGSTSNRSGGSTTKRSSSQRRQQWWPPSSNRTTPPCSVMYDSTFNSHPSCGASDGASGDGTDSSSASGDGVSGGGGGFNLIPPPQFSERGSIHIARNYPFSSTLKRQSVLMTFPKMVVYSKGSPSSIKSICAPHTLPSNYDQIVQHYGLQGFKILAMGMKNISDLHQDQRQVIEKDLTFIGFILLKNRMYPHVKHEIKHLESINHVKTKMITGDNIYSSIYSAIECGMIDRDTEQVYCAFYENHTIVWKSVNVIQLFKTKSGGGDGGAKSGGSHYHDLSKYGNRATITPPSQQDEHLVEPIGIGGSIGSGSGIGIGGSGNNGGIDSVPSPPLPSSHHLSTSQSDMDDNSTTLRMLISPVASVSQEEDDSSDDYDLNQQQQSNSSSHQTRRRGHDQQQHRDTSGINTSNSSFNMNHHHMKRSFKNLLLHSVSMMNNDSNPEKKIALAMTGEAFQYFRNQLLSNPYHSFYELLPFYSQLLCLCHIYTEMSPNQKGYLVSDFKSYLDHIVCMIGDGSNDSIAMNCSDASVFISKRSSSSRSGGSSSSSSRSGGGGGGGGNYEHSYAAQFTVPLEEEEEEIHQINLTRLLPKTTSSSLSAPPLTQQDDDDALQESHYIQFEDDDNNTFMKNKHDYSTLNNNTTTSNINISKKNNIRSGDRSSSSNSGSTSHIMTHLISIAQLMLDKIHINSKFILVFIYVQFIITCHDVIIYGYDMSESMIIYTHIFKGLLLPILLSLNPVVSDCESNIKYRPSKSIIRFQLLFTVSLQILYQSIVFFIVIFVLHSPYIQMQQSLIFQFSNFQYMSVAMSYQLTYYFRTNSLLASIRKSFRNYTFWVVWCLLFILDFLILIPFPAPFSFEMNMNRLFKMTNLFVDDVANNEAYVRTGGHDYVYTDHRDLEKSYYVILKLIILGVMLVNIFATALIECCTTWAYKFYKHLTFSNPSPNSGMTWKRCVDLFKNHEYQQSGSSETIIIPYLTRN
nr:unnamed protein product [Naegleria fowleri]